MPKKTSEKWRAAYHEAGHAVLNLIYGMPFQGISLTMKEEVTYQFEGGKRIPYLMLYTVGIEFSEERLASINREVAAGILDLKEAVTLMAGPVAEHQFVGSSDEAMERGRRFDVQAITACCRAAVSGSDDPSKWAGLLEMEQHMLLAMSLGAYVLIKENWASVKAIAETLHAKKELDYAEALKIAEANGLAKKG